MLGHLESVSHTEISQTFHHTIALFISLPKHQSYSPGRSLICLSVSGMPHKKVHQNLLAAYLYSYICYTRNYSRMDSH